MADGGVSRKRIYLALAGIGLIAAGLTSAFAWSAGLIGARVTTSTFLKATPADFPAGYRRAHGKGICFTGVFRSSGKAARLSSARVFSQPVTPVIGRFSIGAGDPHAADTSTRTVSMALLMAADDGQQWRMKLNNAPYFITRDAEGFLQRAAAYKPDPATGRPDPAKVEAFLSKYPEARKFMDWSASAPWTASFAGAQYNVINSFVLIDKQGRRQPVRWSMTPHAPFVALSAARRETLDRNFLFDEIKQRTAAAPLYWDLVLQLAEPGDPVADPSQPWPASRQRVVAGVLEVSGVADQATGSCRDVNFDPTLVPNGMALSDDPVLATRAGIYAHSYNARLREVGYGRATDAVGKGATQ